MQDVIFVKVINGQGSLEKEFKGLDLVQPSFLPEVVEEIPIFGIFEHEVDVLVIFKIVQ